ncbi:MAG: hypothetical protein RL582_1651 [Bacteroidota bacterium]|jgi:hypothetical protein
MTQVIQTPIFILNEEKKKGHISKHYIKELQMLFRLMTKGKLSPAEGQVYFLLRNKRESAYLQLLKEIFPLRYEIYLEEKTALLEHKKSQ